MFTKILLAPQVSAEQAEKVLLKAKVVLLATEEDAEGTFLWLQGKVNCKSFPFVVKSTLISDQIDWEAQWRDFSPCFKEGLFHLDFAEWGEPITLLLKPGPGFGDLSHPTTRLMMQMMMKEKARVQKSHVLDVGSGSGVLALTAALLGAKEVFGIDIDAAANRHARANARLNGLQVRFQLPGKEGFETPPKQRLILINMIFQEQQMAMQHLPISTEGAYCFSSGILEEQKSSYITWMQELGFEVLETLQEGEWLGFIFRKKPLSRKGSSRL
jgi:ribosomal protein L11 methyltransferase